MPTTPAVSEILRRLSGLRGRIRRIVFLSGAARVVLLAVGLLALSFVADWFLDLPLGVRRFLRLGLADQPAWASGLLWVVLLGISVVGFLAAFRRRQDAIAAFLAFFLLGGVGVLAWAVLRFLVMPSRARLSDDALALRVEERFRGLNDRLAASLDFDRELSEGGRGESPAMMRRVVEEAAAEAKGLEFSQVASSKRAGRRAATAVLAGAVFAGVLASMPETAAIWARRSLALEEVSWPRLTYLVAVVRDADGNEREQDPATPYVAALGQSLTVLARAKGRVPAEVEILDRTADDADEKPLPHRMRPLAGIEGLFEYEFRDVRGDFRFTLRGGDDKDDVPVWSVAVRIPPRVMAVRADLLFPTYLKLPPRRIEGGSMTVPEGTEVTVGFESDAPLARAEATIEEGGATRAAEVVAAAEGAGAGGGSPAATGGSYRLKFTAGKTLRYRLKIVTKDGRENDPGVDTYEVTVLPDAPPRTVWVWPRAPIEASPDARVPLFAKTRDDHAISSLVLEVRPSGATESTRIPLAARTSEAEGGANDRAYGAEQILTYVPVEIASLRDAKGETLKAPSRVDVRVVAVDNRGQEGGGDWTPIDLVRGDEIERRIASRRSPLKNDVGAVRKDLADLRAETAEIAKGPIGENERIRLRTLQFRQGKVRAEVERAARTLTEFFDHYVYDRLGAKVPTERLLALLDRRHRLIFTQPPDSTAPGGAAASEDGETEVFPWSLYREVIAARRDKVVFDTGVLDKMISVLEAAIPTAADLAPAASDASVEAAGRATPESVNALLAAQDRLAAGLDATTRAMAEWQSLSDLILLLRRLSEEQEAIKTQIDKLK